MPTPNPTLRREYKGAAAATTLQNSMSSTDTSFVLVAANNWPTGSVGKFIVTINRGQADEEKILCDSQTTRTVACLLANRGFDGTTAQSHAAGATVECTISAFDADEWNQHTNATTGVHGVATVAGLTETQVFTNKTLGSPAFTGTATGLSAASATLDAASTLGGISGTTLAADRTAWTAYATTLTNITLGNGGSSSSYRVIGKTCYVRFSFSFGSTSALGGGTASFTLPFASTGLQALAGWAYDSSAAQPYVLNGRVLGASTTCELLGATSYASSTTPFTWAVNDSIALAGVYEIA